MQGVVTGTDGASRDQSQQREIAAGPDPVWAYPVAAPPQELPAGPVLPLPPACPLQAARDGQGAAAAELGALQAQGTARAGRGAGGQGLLLCQL